MADLPKFEPLPNVGNVVSNRVTAFNQGYNLYQCINYLQGYVAIVYDSMDALLADWNNFQQVVNENITNIATEETQKILNQWLEDGTLNNLIAKNPLWNQKLDKSGGTMTGNIKFSENTKIVGTTPGGNDIDLIHNTNDGASGNYVQFGDPDAKTVINSSQQPVWHNGDDDYLLLTQKQLDDGLAGKVNKAGDTMTGNLNLNASMNLTGSITRDNAYNIVSMDPNYTIFGDKNYITIIKSKNNRIFMQDSNGSNKGVITTSDVRDNLTSTDKITPLSANQGKVLNDKLQATPWKSLGSSKSKYCKVGNIVFLACDSDEQQPNLVKNSYVLLGALPEGYRPSVEVIFRVSGMGTGLWTDVGKVSTNGNVEIFQNDLSVTQGCYYGYIVSFPVGN